MSKTELLTVEETKAAAAQGWRLSHVYNLATKTWRVMVIGMPSAETASRSLVSRAKLGDALALKALGLVMKSNQGMK